MRGDFELGKRCPQCGEAFHSWLLAGNYEPDRVYGDNGIANHSAHDLGCERMIWQRSRWGALGKQNETSTMPYRVGLVISVDARKQPGDSLRVDDCPPLAR